MRALAYLFARRLKNQFLMFLRTPAKLILTIVMIGLFVFVLWAGNLSDVEAAQGNPMELRAMLLLLYAWMFLMTLYGGLNKGATFFKMSDVNLLFPAPVSPTKILVYGLGQQLSTSLMVGFFLLYQYTWLHQSYGVSVGGLLLILLGYALALFFGQLTAMAAYCLTSVDAPGKDGQRRRAAKILVVLVGLCFLIEPAAYLLAQERVTLATFVDAAALPGLGWFPVAGWLCSAVFCLMQGELAALGWLALTVAFGAAMIWLLVTSRADYYEDVLQASEVAHITRQMSKEGKVYDTRKIKAGATGLNAGMGASALYQKQRLENRRERIFLLDKNSWIFLAVPLAFGFFMREEGLISAFSMATYMQLFTASTGRWVRELLLPFVYLIPETPFRKLWFCLCQSFEKLALESALLWVPLGLILKLSPIMIVLCILARFSFGVLFMAGNLLVERLMGGVLIKWLVLMVYFLLEALLIVPGVVTGIVLHSMGVAWMGLEGTLLLSMLAWNAVLSLLLLFICRNVLERAEMNQLQGA